MVVILIQLPTTGEPTLFHTLCAGEQSVSVRRQMYECIEEEECGEEDEDKFTGRTYIDKHRSKTTKQSIYHLFIISHLTISYLLLLLLLPLFLIANKFNHPNDRCSDSLMAHYYIAPLLSSLCCEKYQEKLSKSGAAKTSPCD